jgi:hypothetical protein
MTTSKKLSLIAAACVILMPAAALCADNDTQSPANDFKTSATAKMIDIKNSVEEYYYPIKPYIYNPVGFASACLLSSMVGFKRIAAVVVFGALIAGSREIIKHLEQAEKTPHNEKNAPQDMQQIENDK